MPGEDELLTPIDVLEGFSAKRARLLLFQTCFKLYLLSVRLYCVLLDCKDAQGRLN